MDCPSICNEFIDQALEEIWKSKCFTGANEFNDGLLFGIGDSNFSDMKQMQQNWENSAPPLFASLIRKIASSLSFDTFDLSIVNKNKACFGYATEQEKHACFFVWPSIKHSPLCPSDANAMSQAIEAVNAKEVNDAFVIWLVDETNAKLQKNFDSWNDAFSPQGIKHVSALNWVRDAFGNEIAQHIADTANRIKAEGILIQGFSVVPLPTNRELSSFIMQTIQKYGTTEIPSIKNRLRRQGISEHNIGILERNIRHDNLYEALFGSAEFAKSLLSSEWRYQINHLSENVEQTGTVVGYIKTIEQLLFGVLQVWVGYDLQVTFGEETSRNRRAPLTKSLLAEKRGKATLGSLTYLYASHHHEYFNNAIYDSELEAEHFRDLLFQLLKSFTHNTRNGKLHKTNFYNQGKVTEIRNEVFDITFLLLGGMKLDERQLNFFNEIRPHFGTDPDSLKIMTKELNEGLIGLTTDSIESAWLIVVRCSANPSRWSISLTVKGNNIDVLNLHYQLLCEPSLDEEMSCVDRLIKQYLIDGCAIVGLRDILTHYVVYNVGPNPLQVELS